MTRKLFLPLTQGETPGVPTVDAVRKRLGGRAATESGAGELVALVSERGVERVGVILFVRGDELDVWLESGLVRRVRRGSVHAAQGEASPMLIAVASDARMFAALHEGQRVRYQHEGGVGEGALVEKCRFGGLVERGDGVVLGVGFRRLWPASVHGAN